MKTREYAVSGLVNGFNAMARTAHEIGSDRLQIRLNAIYENASDVLTNIGVRMGADGTLSVDFLPEAYSDGMLSGFVAQLKGLADEVSHNPAAFQNAKDGMLYGANGGALSQVAARMSSIGQLFDSFM